VRGHVPNEVALERAAAGQTVEHLHGHLEALLKPGLGLLAAASLRKVYD
jgi:hypothetical protein